MKQQTSWPKKQLAQIINTHFNTFCHEKKGSSATGSSKNGNMNGSHPKKVVISVGLTKTYPQSAPGECMALFTKIVPTCSPNSELAIPG
jgi:hypothetical protein